jgi:FMN phosphatase YigB (HAD superfamily)
MAFDEELLAGGAVRAVICDIYGTLLHAGPPPEDAAERWRKGCQEIAGQCVTLEEFDQRCAEAVKAQHAARRGGGEPFPEVDWPAVIRAAIPALDHTRALLLSSLHAACRRNCTAMPHAVEALALLRAAGIVVGIASNAQHYTRDEMTAAGFALTDFHPRLSFLSGDHGFAKPSPRVFSFLTEQLAALGIAPHETLMIGDSVENDIAPAKAAGWRTCLVNKATWPALAGSHPDVFVSEIAVHHPAVDVSFEVHE